jgi:type I site-specific restriction-modification system R (restriction) subunit
MVKFREILVGGKSVEMKADNGSQTENGKEENVENPSANHVEQVQTVEERSSKGGCLGVVLVGLLVLSIIVFV